MAKTTFTTPGITAHVVPAGSGGTARIKVFGSGAGSGGNDDGGFVGAAGGGGGFIDITVAVTPGETLDMVIGNGGGLGRGGTNTPIGGTGEGGGGGGLTRCIRQTGSVTLATGGSGGGGGGGDNSVATVGAGGVGGGATGGAGGNVGVTTGGGGGTQSGGGAGGASGESAGLVGGAAFGGSGGDGGNGGASFGAAANGGTGGGGAGGGIQVDNFAGGGGGGSGGGGSSGGGGGGGSSTSGEAGGGGGGGGPNHSIGGATVTTDAQASGTTGAGQGDADYPASTGDGAAPGAGAGADGNTGLRGAIVFDDLIGDVVIDDLSGNDYPFFIESGQAGYAITGTGFGTDTGSAKIELGSHSTHAASTTLVEQTETGTRTGTAAEFTAVRGGFTQGDPVWLYVTNDIGDLNADGFRILNPFAPDIWDSPPLRDIWCRVFHNTTATAGTGIASYQDASIPSAPKGVMAIATKVSDGTVTPDVSFSVGFADNVTPTENLSNITLTGDDGASPVLHQRGQNNDALIRVYDPTSGAVLAECIVEDYLSDGIRLNWSIADSTAWRFTFVLFGGADYACEVGRSIVTGNVTGVGVAPQLVFASGANQTEGIGAFGYSNALGMFDRDLNEALLWLMHGDTAVSTAADSQVIIDSFASQPDGAGTGYLWQASVTAVNNDGWEKSGTNTDEYQWMAHTFRGAKVQVGVFDKRNGAGSQSVALGFRPQAAGFLCANSVNHLATNADNARSTIGIWDDVTGNETTHAWLADTSTPQNLDQQVDRTAGLVCIDDGGVHESEANVTSGAASIELDWTTGDARAVKIAYFAIEQQTVDSITGTGTAAAQPYACAGTGDQEFLGSGAAVFSSYACAAVGALTFLASGAAAASEFACLGAGTLEHTGTGSAQVPSYGCSGVGAEEFTGSGAAAFSRFDCLGTGHTADIHGSGSCATAPYGALGSGGQEFTGTCAAAPLPYSCAGSGAQQFTGTCTASAQPYECMGFGSSGAQNFGSGTAAFQPYQCTATGFEEFTGTCVSESKQYACSGIGFAQPKFIGTGSAIASRFGVDAEGTLEFTGSGTVGSQPHSCSGIGSLGLVGSGAAVTAPFGGVGAGTLEFNGAANASPQPYACTSAGLVIIAITGTGAAAAPPYQCTGVGNIQILHTDATPARRPLVRSENRLPIVRLEGRNVVVKK